MFDIGYSELLLIAVVTLLVVGPKELPNLLRTIGRWVGRGRSMARHFRAGFDAMIREAEIEEMQKQWTAHNAAIMAATPNIDATPATSTSHGPAPERDPEAEDDDRHYHATPAAPPLPPDDNLPDQPPADSDKQIQPPPAP